MNAWKCAAKKHRKQAAGYQRAYIEAIQMAHRWSEYILEVWDIVDELAPRVENGDCCLGCYNTWEKLRDILTSDVEFTVE